MNCARVFETLELRERIFSHVGNQALARSARVCKDWTDAALDKLWANMNNIVPVFKILAPMQLVSFDNR